MAQTTTLVLKDTKTNYTMNIGAKTTVKDVVKYQEKYEDAEIIIEEEESEADPYSPVNIKLVQLNNDKKAAADTESKFTGIVISFAKPSDWTDKEEYQARLYNKEYKKFGEAVPLVNISIKNGANTDYALTSCSNELVYYFLKQDMSITPPTYRNNYLVQVQRKVNQKWSDWGTELHTHFTVGGKATIFKTQLDLSYSSGDENIGLKPGQEITVKYANILDEEFAKGFPKRIFAEKPETSLLGTSVKIAKFNYNTRTKNFNLAINLNTGDIDIATDAKLLEFYKTSYEKPDVKEVKDIPAADKTAITNLKQKGIQLLPGVNIQEVYFEVNITDKAPEETKK